MGKKHGTKWIHEKTVELLNLDETDRIKLLNQMVQSCDYAHEKACIELCYIYGARPQELLMLKKENFVIIGNIARVRLPTVKEGIPREIELDIEITPFLKDIMIYVSSLPDSSRIFNMWTAPTNINHVFRKIKMKSNGKHDYNPDVFRHFRMSNLGYLGATMMQLKQWKGARSQESVESYLGFKPITEFKKAIR